MRHTLATSDNRRVCALANTWYSQSHRKKCTINSTNILQVLLLRHQGPEHIPWSVCPGCTAAYEAYCATLIPPVI